MNVKLVLNIFVVMLSVCLFGQTVFAQVSGGGAIVAIDERTMVGGGSVKGEDSPISTTSIRQTTGTAKKSSVNKKTKTSKTTTASNTPKKVSPRTAPRGYNGPVLGDKYSFLNFEIAKAVKPIHTIAAQDAGAKGLVQVEVLIEVDGTVLEARARTGNKLLHGEAERAALATIFNKPSVNGQQARATGFMVFRFGPPED